MNNSKNIPDHMPLFLSHFFILRIGINLNYPIRDQQSPGKSLLFEMFISIYIII